MRGRHTRTRNHPRRSIPVQASGRRQHGRHRRSRRPFHAAVVLLIALAAGVLAAGGASAATEPARAACTDLDIPVASGLVAARMHASLCLPSSPAADIPLQVLVSGGTYNHTYWSGLGLPAYSYTARATSAGFATLAVDRIGTGASSHPLSTLVTASMQADALHQVITRARSGGLTGQKHARVALAGHSLGSMAAVIAAARHPADVDALILTGYSHRIAPAELLTSLASMYPAALEGRPLDPGYLTTRPGVRGSLFHATGEVDPAMLAADEATKDVASATELPGVLVGLSRDTSRRITAPVLEANGEKDSWACTAVDCTSADSLRAAEQGYFTAPLTTYVQPHTGHSLALARDGGAFTDFASGWLHHVLAETARSRA
ncbi:alpha/beta hydrolase [Amycolatopsis sp. WAC 01375]|uniref:alpha/beta fold hydrolase n=1 Tax=Amycolatopsis sp. WAC 01375 TaxID=2203194 RepID=UPI000F79CE0C|nr:alpha/beta hydrolase [Amycolatopsis sp. WAC 01375]RSM80595.1 alpha/beta hydrolase [Amycolatopsis sp. WAC 01375]